MAVRAKPPFCWSCGTLMYPQSILKGYEKTGPDADRLTCPLHGPNGDFRHLGADRAPAGGA